MSKIDLIDPKWVDMVFADRNREYGAYKLRKQTSKRNILSILIMLALAAIFASIIGIQAIVEANKPKVAVTNAVELSKLSQKKKKAKVEKKKEPVKQEQKEEVKQVKSSVKFTAPVIKRDEDVKPEDEMKSQNDLNNSKTAIGAFNVQGNDEGGAVLKATQTIITQEPPKHEEVATSKVFDVVEQMPSFPGGNSALMQYLANNIKYPVVAQENGVQGRVVVSFVVERDGSITDVNVVRGVDPSLDREAQRVVRSMPRWNPGKQNGQAVRVKYNVPVSFRLQ